MFFGLKLVEGHPCCRMQEVVEKFFDESITRDSFSLDLFPEWFRSTVSHPRSGLSAVFQRVHGLLHSSSADVQIRQNVRNEVLLISNIDAICEGSVKLSTVSIDWKSSLGVEIKSLMLKLYESLDLAIFKRNGNTRSPTQQFYSEFVALNGHVCPFCGLEKFKNPRGNIREDFDHYLHKSAYPLAAANMRNIIPTCGTCNKGYKRAKDVLVRGVAFYPYSELPKVKVEVECTSYPVMADFKDSGKWDVRLELVDPNPNLVERMEVWNDIYEIKNRLIKEIEEYLDEWMDQVIDVSRDEADVEEFRRLIALAKASSSRKSIRKRAPGEILKEAFYDFMLNNADAAFVESFRRSGNRSSWRRES